MELIDYSEVKKALLLALKDFDKDTILEISQDDWTKDSWCNGCEVLNGLDHNTIKSVLSDIQ